MAKRYEGSAKDNREDARGMRATGMQRQDYEKSARDRKEDKAGQAAGGFRGGGKIKNLFRGSKRGR